MARTRPASGSNQAEQQTLCLERPRSGPAVASTTLAAAVVAAAVVAAAIPAAALVAAAVTATVFVAAEVRSG